MSIPLSVWRVDLSSADLAERLFDLLDADERARAERYARPELRRRFVIAHGALRSVLGQALNQAPQAIGFDYNAWGKPRLADRADLVFNLSHSQDLALCALGPPGDLGVDVEYLERSRTLETLDLAQRFFAREEYEAIALLPTGRRRDQVFTRYWTRKEAYIKAKGLGLSLPLQSFCIDNANFSRLAWSLRWPDDVQQLRFWDIPVTSAYCASLAYTGASACAAPNIMTWEPDDPVCSPGSRRRLSQGVNQ